MVLAAASLDPHSVDGVSIRAGAATGADRVLFLLKVRPSAGRFFLVAKAFRPFSRRRPPVAAAPLNQSRPHSYGGSFGKLVFGLFAGPRPRFGRPNYSRLFLHRKSVGANPRLRHCGEGSFVRLFVRRRGLGEAILASFGAELRSSR